jgi:hypothetical protein
MLAMSDRKGRVWASIPGLANRARVSLEDAEVALNTLSSPDKYSRTPDHEGRRIEPIDGGWVLLNHEKYRSIRDEETTREVARNHMRKKRANVDAKGEQLSAVIRGSHNADADADTVNKILDASRPAPAKRFIKPTLAEVDAYCLERKNDVHPPKFIDHYESNGWKVGRNPMRDWKAAVRTWEQTGDRHATRQPVDNSAVGKVRAANERARQREAADRQPDAPGVGANGSHVRPPLDQ